MKKKKSKVKSESKAFDIIPEIGNETIVPVSEVKQEIVKPLNSEVTDKMINDYLFGSKTTLTEDQKILFIQTAKALQLNPFKREIYAVSYEEKYYGKSYTPPRYKLSLITGYEVYLKRAERSGKLSGWSVRVDGQANTLRAIITIFRKDWKEPLIHEVFNDEYNNGKNMWEKKPMTMLKKVAIAQGFRLAFPDELGGMPYSSEELPEEMVKNAEYIPAAPEQKQIEQLKPETKKEAEKPAEVKYTIPQGITPDTLCNIGPCKSKPIPYKDIHLDKLLILWEKSVNPSELEGVLSWSIRANMEVKLAGKQYDWDKFLTMAVEEKLKEYVKIAGEKK